jgi:hypothetical protein
LANSEAPKFRLTYYPSEGTEAWSNPCGNLGFVGREIGSPTVSHRFLRVFWVFANELAGCIVGEPVAKVFPHLLKHLVGKAQQGQQM